MSDEFMKRIRRKHMQHIMFDLLTALAIVAIAAVIFMSCGVIVSHFIN